MEFRKINKFCHEYDFPYHDYLKKHWEKKLINHWKENIVISTLNKEWYYENPFKELHNYLIPKLKALISNWYWVDESYFDTNFAISIQDNTVKDLPQYHQHLDFGETITGTFYINPPIKGGKLGFYFPPQYSFEVQPLPNKLYLFPSWAVHSALPQDTKEYRICINYHYVCGRRPVHKISGDIW